MSEIAMTVVDGKRAIRARVHGSVGERVVAALSADPWTIAELDVAVGRYGRQDGDRGLFAGWHAGVCREPWDAGLVLIDLAGRVVAGRSTYSILSRTGTVSWHDGRAASDRQVPYQLRDDWAIGDEVESFERLSRQRRLERAAGRRLDEREILFGQLAAFIVREVHARRSDLGAMDNTARYEFVRDIHARWLMTPRHDLGDRCPRDVMIDDRHAHIVADVQNQIDRWSMVGEPPPGLGRESTAYRFGGFGTHEIVLYYELARELLNECVRRLARRVVADDDLPAEIEHLQRLRQEWFHGPQEENLSGQTPAAVIDRERRRLPESESCDDAAHDPDHASNDPGHDDCPLCQMFGSEERRGSVFWFLDGCNMDTDFAFSFHRTYREWEIEDGQFHDWLANSAGQ